MRSFTVNENDADQRVDKFVSKTARGIPTSLLYKYIRKKRIKVNGKRCQASDRLAAGDTVEMYVPDEFFSRESDASEYVRAKVTLDVVWEDENLLLVNKPAGVLSHTGDSGDAAEGDDPERGTLIFAIKAYLAASGEYVPASENSFAPALCNRIDRNTSGIVIAAKNAAALRAVNAAIRDREIGKYYLCAVHGVPERRAATLTGYLSKNAATNTVTVGGRPSPGARKIVTSYRVLRTRRDPEMSLLEVELGTGRTHQIRAHLSSIGHPLVGEGKYGVNREDRKLGVRSQALCSYKVVFRSHSPELEYLFGREFSIPADAAHVKFLTLFEGGK